MMKKLIFTFLLLATQPAFALLAPLEQSLLEIKGIVENPDMTSSLPSAEKILEIEMVESGYLIHTRSYTMLVEIVYEKEGGKLGPAQYKLIFHEPSKS